LNVKFRKPPSKPPSLPSTKDSRINPSAAGTYHNVGYGEFKLCHQDSKSEYCTQMRKDFGVLKDEVWKGALYGSWSQEKLWGTHILFSPKEDGACESSYCFIILCLDAILRFRRYT